MQGRIAEHAVLQTLGYPSRLIAGLIVAEGVVLALLGGVLGAAAAVASKSVNSPLAASLSPIAAAGRPARPHICTEGRSEPTTRARTTRTAMLNWFRNVLSSTRRLYQI